MGSSLRAGVGIGSALAFVALVFLSFEAGVEVRVLCSNVRPGAEAEATRALFDTGTFLDLAEDGSGAWVVSSPWELRNSRCRLAADEGRITEVTPERRFDAARIAGAVGVVLVAALGLFQAALAAGAPWGAAAWGGRHPGRLPRRLRGASLASVPLLAVGGWALVEKARPFGAVRPVVLGAPTWVGPVLGAFTLLFTASIVGNVLSSSRSERRVGIPLAVLTWACFVTVLLAK